jgi:ketosteroid isomerase-like protein
MVLKFHLMSKHSLSLFFGALVLLLSSCLSNKKDASASIETEKRALLKVDREFSKMSETNGMKNAYLEYLDSNAVLLRPNSLPIIDADAVDYVIGLEDTGYTITWKPTSADVAASGELGYTYGMYEIAIQAKDTTLLGTYVNIWKKQVDGKWKLMLQSNNEGVE